jgi:hypothetical protein
VAGLHVYGAQIVVGLGLQFPLPSHAWAFTIAPPSHVPARQVVDDE